MTIIPVKTDVLQDKVTLELTVEEVVQIAAALGMAQAGTIVSQAKLDYGLELDKDRVKNMVGYNYDAFNQFIGGLFA